MRNAIVTHNEASDWLRKLAVDAEVLFPIPQGKANFSFQRIDSLSEFCFTPYRPTIIPPSKQITPDQEVMFNFKHVPGEGFSVTPVFDNTKRILAGIRPCDLRAMVQMDAVFSTPPVDPLYWHRRNNTAIVAYTCLTPCDSHCFCGTTGSLNQRDGADVFITEIAEDLLVEALNSRGEELLISLTGEDCSPERAEELRYQAELTRPDPFGRQFKVPVSSLAALMKKTYRSPIYERYAERCYSCSTCNLVCPTCYCFEVHDDLALDGQSGSRVRSWDGCMNPSFAVVAGGHDFRHTPAERQRHRLQRKFEFLPTRYDLGSFCVGCGRCGRQCTTGIDIFDIVNDLAVTGGGAP